MSRMIVAVGGTGQMVLHHYLQLFLLGVVKEPFRAVVVDTDDVLPSIGTMVAFLERLRYGAEGNHGLGVTLPTVEFMRPNAETGETITHILTGNRRISSNDPHPAQAFFDSEMLGQNLTRGLFARPAISSVLTSGGMASHILRPPSSSTVVMVGSVIGGTGGGLLVPLCHAVHDFTRREGIEHVKLRGVFFGQYFKPQAGRLTGDVTRFRSNQLSVLRTIREALSDSIHSFYLVGGAGNLVDRDPEGERKSESQPWPKTNEHPFWQGVRALEFMLGETTKEKNQDFNQREIETLPRRPEIESCRQSLDQALLVTREFIDRDAVQLLTGDFWLDHTWGQGLTNLVAHYWRIAMDVEGREAMLADFPGQLQRALEVLWSGEADELGLCTVFPGLDQRQRVRPKQIRSVPWPDIEAGGHHPELFEGRSKTAERLAATLVFWMLRRGSVQ